MSYTKTVWTNGSGSKINADNLNNIEQGIENNDVAIGDMDELETTATNLVGAINEVKDNSNYEIITSGEWTYKKYNNGLIEMWHKHVGSYSSSDQYAGSPVRWITTEIFSFPVTLTEMISINSTLGSQGRLMGCNIPGSGSSLTQYQLYIYDYGQYFLNQSVAIYTTVIGKWK